MKIYALRHGQTDLNASKRIQGCGYDPPLNAVGRRQAKSAARLLESKGIGVICSSPLKRARETAEIVAKRLKFDKTQIIKCERLRERDFGDYEGLPFEAVDLSALRRYTDNAATPGGETIRDVAARVWSFLDEALNSDNLKGKTPLFVAHAHILRAMDWYFNGLPEPGGETAFVVDNCAVFEFARFSPE